MSRSRGERLASSKGRPKRRAAASAHFFKYQLAGNPSKVEKDDLKRALQESMEEQVNTTPPLKGRVESALTRGKKKSNRVAINNSMNSSDVSRGSNDTSGSSFTTSNDVSLPNGSTKRTSVASRNSVTPLNKRIKSGNKQINHNKKCDKNPNNTSQLPTLQPQTTTSRPIRTYSRNQSSFVDIDADTRSPKTSTPSAKPSPPSNSGSSSKDKSSHTQVSKSTQTPTPKISNNSNHNQAILAKRRTPQGSWSLLGIPEEKVVYLRDDEPPRRLICYPAIKHIEGDVIQVRDSVLLRSGAKKTDLPYIAKICSFWKDPELGVMMSLLWYYRPEHTEEGRKNHHLPDDIFASRHRDVDSVECIEDKCYVLTFNEYCRYKKRCKMEQVNTSWSLADVTIPVSNESYPRRNRIPDSDVNPELVFCCRQIYDSRMRRLIKNPLINPKYGHI